MTQLTDKAIVFKFPEGASNFYINDQGDLIYTNKWREYFSGWWLDADWSVLSLLDEMTEEKWREVVEEGISFGKVKMFKDYEFVGSCFYTATESGLSLLSSKGVTDFKNKLLLVKK